MSQPASGRGASRPGLIDRLIALFRPGPLDWALKLPPERHRFHAGTHLHGLEEHDLAAHDLTRRRR